MERQLRVTLITGRVRQGRYLRHSETDLEIHDGLRRVIQLRMIEDIVEVPGCPSGTCAADQLD